MRATLAALLTLFLLVACSQAPVQPTPAQAATVTAPPPAAVTIPPPAPAVAALAQSPTTTAPVQVQEVPVDKDHREVLIHTNQGDIVVQLDATQAPLTVKHFLTYVKEHYFDGSAFYRVMPGFMIQAGGYTADLDYRAPRHKPVPFESSALTNQRGSLAMARDADPNSANTAFFINVVDNTQQLGPQAGTPGYAVFGQVVRGMDVVDKIAAVETHTVSFMDPNTTPFEDVPVKPVRILKVTLLPLPGPGKP